MSEFLQIAQVSAQISHDHMVTAFHFFISNLIAVPDEASSFPFPSSILPSTSTDFSSAIFDSAGIRRQDNKLTCPNEIVNEGTKRAGKWASENQKSGNFTVRTLFPGFQKQFRFLCDVLVSFILDPKTSTANPQ